MDIRRLIDELRRRGATPYVLSDVAPLGASILQSVQQAITAADYVLVVLGDADASQNSIFEAGIAFGLGKPIVIISDPQGTTPPDLAGLLTIRARPDDLPAISFALDQAEGRSATPPQLARATGHALGPRADQLLDELADTSNVTERAALNVLTQALEDSGTVAVQNPASDRGFDLGVWSDDLDAIAANPLLIELKHNLRAQTVKKTLDLLRLSPNARVILLVFLDPAVPAAALLNELPFPILAISLHELLERMRSSSFAEVVRDLRNRSVHGLPQS
jgi:hypothetical protein